MGMVFLVGSMAQATTNEAVLVQQLLEEALKSQMTQEGHERAPYLGCRNTQITSFWAERNETGGVRDVYFTTADNIQVTSLEATINKESFPVEYRETAEGYEARVRLNDAVEGHIYAELGAGSVSTGSCNDTLHTSFEVPEGNSHRSLPTKQSNAQVSAVTSTDATNVEVALRAQVEAAQAQVTTLTAEPVEEENTEEALIATDISDGDSQTALIGSALAGSVGAASEGACTTLGASLSWHIWLFVLWLFLVGVWLLVVYLVEPHMNKDSYKGRLYKTVGLAGLGMIVFWYVLNQCFTHIWFPITVAILSLALVWLYLEDTSGDMKTA